MFLQQRTKKKQSLNACIAMLLVLGLLYTFLPSVSDAHTVIETITMTTTTTVVTEMWDEIGTDEAGEPIMGWVEVNRTTTTTTSSFDSVISHSHFPWSTVIASGATLLGVVLTLVIKKNGN